MAKELTEEIKQITEQRGINTEHALSGAVKEINQKWNAIANLFEKEYGG